MTASDPPDGMPEIPEIPDYPVGLLHCAPIMIFAEQRQRQGGYHYLCSNGSTCANRFERKSPHVLLPNGLMQAQRLSVLGLEYDRLWC